MFVRKVAALLKADSLQEFTQLMECEILPWLRKQDGFLDLIILAVPDTREIATISFWRDRSHAEAYGASAYPEVLELLAKLLDGIPYVKTFDVVSSTISTMTRLRQSEVEQIQARSTQEGYGMTENRI
jgi:hypothetical protein